MNEGFEFTLHAPRWPGVRPVLRRNPPACGRLLAQPRVRFWPALGLAGLSPVVVRGWRRSEGGDGEQGRREDAEAETEGRRREGEPVGGGGVAAKGRGRRNKGGVKLRFCPSLISIVYATVQP